MSDPDRGAYTPPTDAPLSFDARQPVRGARPAPMMLIVSAAVLLLLVIAIVLFYRSGVREAGAPPQAVGTPVGAMKSQAPESVQPVDPAAGLQIYQSQEGEQAPAAPNFTAPPEEPQMRPAPAPVVVAPPPPKAPPVTPPISAPVQIAPVQPAPKVAPPPAKVVAPPAKVVTPPPAKVVTPPAPKAAPTPTAPAAGGGSAVQIGAVSSTALADKAWNDAIRIAPGAGAGKGKRVEAIEKNGGTLYRTQVTGFANRAAAQAFCDQLKAAGKSCFVK